VARVEAMWNGLARLGATARSLVARWLDTEASPLVPDVKQAELRTRAPGSSAASPAASPSDVFTPTRPRAGHRTLVGRTEELDRVLDALLEDSAHVVLYSERGRGKTSLANLSVERLRRRGAIVARHACEAESDFDSMIRGLARDLPRSLLAMQPRLDEWEGCEALLPDRKLRPADVGAIPRGLTCPLVIFVIDEFDRVLDPDTRTRLADTIKLVSDRGLKLRFMIVGVSATLEQIIGQHPSIQRAIAGIHLPLLKDEEVADMLTRGGEQAGIGFGQQAVALVCGVACGMPYMAQLLGLRIAQSALRRSATDVSPDDLSNAVQRLIDEASAPTLATYAALTASDQDMEAALENLAGAQRDPWARITVDRAGAQVLVGGRRMSQASWQKLIDAGVVVQPDGPAGQAHIADRLLTYHVQLLAARSALLRQAREASGPADGTVRLAPLAATA